jgi:hypothetical protein
MSELANPRHEKACQLRADGKPQAAAYNEAFEVSEDANGSNASRFFKRFDIRTRVDEIKHRRAVLAELDCGWVLQRLMAVAKNAEANLDDYFVRNADGERIGIDLSQVPREKMAAIEEVTVEETIEGKGEGAVRIRRTKIKLRSASAAIQAAELLGRYLGLWKDKGPADAPVIEVYWRDSPTETPQEPNGPRMLSRQPCSDVVPENLDIPNIAAKHIDEAADVKTQPAVNGTSRPSWSVLSLRMAIVLGRRPSPGTAAWWSGAG